MGQKCNNGFKLKVTIGNATFKRGDFKTHDLVWYGMQKGKSYQFQNICF